MSLYDKRIELIGFEEDEGRDKYQYDEVDLKKAIQELRNQKYPEGKTFLELMAIFQKRVNKIFGKELCVEDMNDGEKG